MVLLHTLHALSEVHHWHLTVAHLNHQLRGRASNADERFVRGAASRMDLPVFAERADVRLFARTHKVSVEMAARKVRHDFLARTAAQLQIPTVALAHHADDQVELFFLRVLRGSGGEGLAGMRWRNVSPSDTTIELVRPLLDQSKSVLHEFAATRKIRFREDATNVSVDIVRNRIRHELLPLLRRKYQPAIERAVLRLMEITGAEAEVVSQAARDWMEGKGGMPFSRLPIAVQRRCVQMQCAGKIAVDFELIERLRTAPGRAVSVGTGLCAILQPNGQVQLRRMPTGSSGSEPLNVILSGRSGEIAFNALKIRWQIGKWNGSRPVPKVRGCECFDADKVGSSIVLRHWRPGDRFLPIGMSSPVKLQDLFTNQRIPRERRHQLALAETAAGEIFWVQDLRISERFKLTRDTNRRLQWRWYWL